MKEKPAAVVLAGGESRRMGSVPKALLPLHGLPMIKYVVRRLEPQVGFLCISVEGDGTAFSEYGLPLVPDVISGHAGPLAGLCSAMLYLQSEKISKNLLVCPCDAPLVPADLAPRLNDIMDSSGRGVSVVRYRGELQPTFSLWNKEIFSEVEQAVIGRSLSGFKQFLQTIPHAVLDWEEQQPNPFFNVNTSDDLRRAAVLLDPAGISADDGGTH